ncbi:hypothetical protein ABFS82_11G103900 [Erythranthe guttata]
METRSWFMGWLCLIRRRVHVVGPGEYNSEPQIILLNKGCSQYNATNIPDFFNNNLNATFSDRRTQLSGGGGTAPPPMVLGSSTMAVFSETQSFPRRGTQPTDPDREPRRRDPVSSITTYRSRSRSSPPIPVASLKLFDSKIIGFAA